MGKQNKGKQKAKKKKPAVAKKKNIQKGKGKTYRSKKDRFEQVKKISDQYAKGEHTIESVCAVFGVEYPTFYCWVTEGRRGFVQEAHDYYKKACDKSVTNFRLLIKNKARIALANKLEIQEFEEIHREVKTNKEGKVVGQTVKKIKKVILPDTTAIIFALKNVDKVNFSEGLNNTNVNVNVASQMTDAELEKEIQKKKVLLKVVA